MNGYGLYLLAQHLMDAGHSRDYALAAVARDEFDVLDWAVSVAESAAHRSPRDSGDEYVRGWMAGAAAVEERLVVEAERARLEAAAGGVSVPPESPSITPELAARAAARVAERKEQLARAMTPGSRSYPAGRTDSRSSRTSTGSPWTATGSRSSWPSTASTAS